MADPQPVTTTDDPRLHRHPVALTVILDADGLDLGDAYNVAQAVVIDAPASAGDEGALTAPRTRAGHLRTAEVRAVRPLHQALRTGALTIGPAAKRPDPADRAAPERTS